MGSQAWPKRQGMDDGVAGLGGFGALRLTMCFRGCYCLSITGAYGCPGGDALCFSAWDCCGLLEQSLALLCVLRVLCIAGICCSRRSNSCLAPGDKLACIHPLNTNTPFSTQTLIHTLTHAHAHTCTCTHTHTHIDT
ncbi:hypothetical protein GOODEAATRI_017508 [Goodea atripinnis]|uniref:Uncharacterized protein n=1 Tax=Goodea atripinnis TaxID=208336 RepID=A0ABV0PPQ6_9TELE